MARNLKNGDEILVGDERYRVILDKLCRVEDASPPAVQEDKCPNCQRCPTCGHVPQSWWYVPGVYPYWSSPNTSGTITVTSGYADVQNDTAFGESIVACY